MPAPCAVGMTRRLCLQRLGAWRLDTSDHQRCRRALSQWAIDPLPRVSLPVVGDSTARFPVNRIFCVGRNYSEHATEMRKREAGFGVTGDEREPPFFFLKASDCAVSHPSAEAEPAAALRIPFPPATSDLHFEAEMVVALGSGGRDIETADALGHVYGYAIGLDLTRRDIQDLAKQQRRPWTAAKSFAAAAPCSAVVPASTLASGHPTEGRIWLSLDGTLQQDSNIKQLTWNVPEVIAALSSLFTLEPGDLIMTGTPAGVGAVAPGQRLKVGLEALGAPLSLTVDVY